MFCWAAFAAVWLGFACGFAVGWHRAAARPPRLTFYGRRQLTGSEARQRLFGGQS